MCKEFETEIKLCDLCGDRTLNYTCKKRPLFYTETEETIAGFKAEKICVCEDCEEYFFGDTAAPLYLPMSRSLKAVLTEKYKTSLWCDLKSNLEKAEFLACGRAWDTGIIAGSLMRELTAVYLLAYIVIEKWETSTKGVI